MKANFGSKKFRDTWVAVHVKRGLATQIRALRGELSQSAFGRRIKKPQNVVSRLEDPNYGSMTIQTLLHIASRLDIGLLVKFVPFSRIVRETNNITPEDLAPLSYDAEQAFLSSRAPEYRENSLEREMIEWAEKQNKPQKSESIPTITIQPQNWSEDDETALHKQSTVDMDIAGSRIEPARQISH